MKNEYIEFLKEYERRYNDYTCVPNVQYKTSDKFMFGAVLEMNGISYFVPVSSFSKPREDVILITICSMDKDGG